MLAFSVPFSPTSIRPSLPRYSTCVYPPNHVRSARTSATTLLSMKGADDLTQPPSIPYFQNDETSDLFPNQTTSIEQDIAQPPISGGDAGGASRDDDSEDDDYTNLLREFGRADEVLPPELKLLPKAQLTAYLEATRNGFVRWLAKVWPGWRRRVAADPDFPFKVLMEETVGLGLSGSGMIAARGKDILNELDFAFCDIAVGGTLNFILVYLLTPAIVVGGGVQTGLMASVGRFAKSLPANAFSPGSYSIGSRLAGFLYKGGLFAVCGFGGSLLGTSLSQVLVFVRRSVAGNDGVVEKPLPNVAVNSLAWAGFMFFSSNPRYQSVAGMERVLFGVAPETVAKVGSGALRTVNNVLGGANWVWWARAIGLQEKPSEGKGKEE